jgi:hypothetical protein
MSEVEERNKSIVEMYFKTDKSQTEVADAHDVSRATVRRAIAKYIVAQDEEALAKDPGLAQPEDAGRPVDYPYSAYDEGDDDWKDTDWTDHKGLQAVASIILILVVAFGIIGFGTLLASLTY